MKSEGEKMKINVHEIGKYHFVEINGYVTSLNATMTKEEEIENIKLNFDNLKNQSVNEEESFFRLIETFGMRKREDWIGYEYDGHFTTTLDDGGFKATLPIKNGLGNYQKLEISLRKEEDGEKIYSVFSNNDKSEGSIVNLDQEVLNFFEDFIAEVIFENGVLLERELFPFKSKSLRKEFNFYPALITIERGY